MTPVRVLVIEHNQFLLRLVIRFLRETFSDEISVAGALRDDEPAWMRSRRLAQHIILLDVDALDNECAQLIRRLRQLFANAHIVAMASPVGGSTLYPRQTALAAGADDFISKLDLNTKLLPIIRAAMSGSGNVK